MKNRRRTLLCAGAGALAAVLTLEPAVAGAVPPAAGCPMPNQTGTCTMATPLLPLDPATQPKFQNELPVPVDYTPDKLSFPGFDYYEIGMGTVTHPGVAFPQPPGGAASVPAGKQWTGLVDPITRAPLFTPVWGYGQVNQGGGPLGGARTWPAMNFRATRGTPVKVKWVNDAPDQHLLCPDPANADVPCAIDRTLMGTLVDLNGNGVFDPGEIVNPFGGPMQADNAMVIHLHGGEIPPDSDGFAELWVGNPNTAKLYNPPPPAPAVCTPVTPAAGISAGVAGTPAGGYACGAFAPAGSTTGALIEPPFTIPAGAAVGVGVNGPDPIGSLLASVYTPGQLLRPKDNFIFYNYPMVQDAATIWYHDHALGKTRVNVAAGPAGFFIVEDPAREGPMYAAGELPPQGDCKTAGGVLGGRCYDIPIALQDRAFNADGTINFPNGLGQTMPAGWIGPWNPLTPSAVPTFHPQWVPEYFGDTAVINGAIWPKLTVDPRPYRLRFLGGSNARCWTLGMKIAGATTQPGFVGIATEQGYLTAPVPTQTFTICPGERYEVVVDFSKYAGQQIFVTNTAGAPFPTGPTPQAPASPYAQLAQVMRFDVLAAPRAGSPAPVAWTPPLAFSGASPLTLPASVKTREMILNEVTDPAGNPVRIQIDAKPFEAPVTETPKRGTVETWKIINTTIDVHPIHLHLVKFKVISRQRFNTRAFGNAIGLANLTPTGGTITPVPIAPFLLGTVKAPAPIERGWKDVVQAYPGEVVTIQAKWDGSWTDCPVGSTVGGVCGKPALTATEPYFEPVTAGPYVWHCHIVDHEDNEMMRPSLVVP